MLSVSAIIFDFDGVILESAEIKTDAFRQLFEPYGEQVVEEVMNYHRENTGISRFVKFEYAFRQVMKKAYDETLAEELNHTFSTIVKEKIMVAPFVWGMDLFLMEYHNQVSCFVASGSEENELKEIIKERNMAHFFLEIHGGHRKKAVIGKDIMERHGINRSDVVFIGDATADRDAARVLGIPFIARVTGENSSLDNCRYRVNDFTGLAGLLSGPALEVE